MRDQGMASPVRMRLTKQTEYALRALLWLAPGTRVGPWARTAGGTTSSVG
jgi:hypothetical protein